MPADFTVAAALRSSSARLTVKSSVGYPQGWCAIVFFPVSHKGSRTFYLLSLSFSAGRFSEKLLFVLFFCVGNLNLPLILKRNRAPKNRSHPRSFAVFTPPYMGPLQPCDIDKKKRKIKISSDFLCDIRLSLKLFVRYRHEIYLQATKQKTGTTRGWMKEGKTLSVRTGTGRSIEIRFCTRLQNYFVMTQKNRHDSCWFLEGLR